MLFTNKQLGNFAKDPAVVRFRDQYYLYYTIKYNHADFGAPEKIGIGIAQSRDLEEWENIGELPLEDACEKNGVGAPHQARSCWRDVSTCFTRPMVTARKTRSAMRYRRTDFILQKIKPTLFTTLRLPGVVGAR